MRKISVFLLVLSLVLFSGSALASQHMLEKGTWTVGGDFDLGGTLSADNDWDVDSGFTIDGEYMMPAKNKLSYGGGIAYQLSRTLKDDADAEFNFIPLYGILKYHMENDAYVVGHLGYNLFNGNATFKDGEELSGGFYYAAGIGIGMEKYNADLLYTVNNGSWGTQDVSYSKLSLSFGMNF